MKTAARSEKQERREVCMIEVSDTVVDPRTVMVHFHYASTKDKTKRDYSAITATRPLITGSEVNAHCSLQKVRSRLQK
jgi:hypothetical protein